MGLANANKRMKENTRYEHNHYDKSLRMMNIKRESLMEHFTYLIWKAIITWLMCFISNYSINKHTETKRNGLLST